jgi:acetylglutamate kinase
MMQALAHCVGLLQQSNLNEHMVIHGAEHLIIKMIY